MKSGPEPVEPGLPATVRFVTIIGLFMVAGWLLMFWLLMSRW